MCDPADESPAYTLRIRLGIQDKDISETTHTLLYPQNEIPNELVSYLHFAAVFYCMLTPTPSTALYRIITSRVHRKGSLTQ